MRNLCTHAQQLTLDSLKMVVSTDQSTKRSVQAVAVTFTYMVQCALHAEWLMPTHRGMWTQGSGHTAVHTVLQ